MNLKADTNQAAGRQQLILQADKTSVDPVAIDYSDYEEDNEAPQIAGDVEKTGRNAITFSLQDENGVNEKDAGDKSHYIIRTKSDNDKGKCWTVDSASGEERDGETVVTLTVKADFFTGDYILK